MSRQPHNRSRLCNAVRSGELVPIIQFVLQARFQGFFYFILLFLIPTCVAQTLGKVQRVQKRHFDIDALAPPPPPPVTVLILEGFQRKTLPVFPLAKAEAHTS